MVEEGCGLVVNISSIQGQNIQHKQIFTFLFPLDTHSEIHKTVILDFRQTKITTKEIYMRKGQKN